MVEIDLNFDVRLLGLIQKDSVEAFKLAYNQYAPGLLRYALKKIGDKEIAEDIVQNTYVELWEKRFEIKSNISGFLFQSLKFQIFNYYRSEKVRDKYLLHLSVFLDEINKVTPHKYLEAKELFLEIEALTKQLPKQCRKVFVMSRFEVKSNDEIAEELEISKRTVENYITQALAFIRKKNHSAYIVLTTF
ncbi:RNA polymerase sigma-70 factor [Sphingobacterium sp. BN32]|uniref:RNA polymerase sigma-70 factor n=1 Tax=Sphingobacterium sp. BN32 TaxID=3058432 RepID=UPI00265CFD03|nr:RNA polymerase sigma-70 factor [Sphingobacterium sp. BN32]WKK56874.1 RNA polymerase sigma-70 factor [Sphingobacterium sp. BN32]